MSSGRFLQITGGAGVIGVAYYLYNAGGSPKLAEKKFEADASKLSTEVKSHLPGGKTEIQKQTELTGAEAGKKLDDLYAQANNATHKVDAKLEQYRKDAERAIDKNSSEISKQATEAIDKFDKSVSEGAEKAKKGVSGWFGGK